MSSFEVQIPRPHMREVRLRSLLSLAATPMIVADRDRQLVDCNPMACRVLGATREDMLSRRVDDFTAAESGFDVELFWSRFMEERCLNGAYPAKRLDGTMRPVLYAATAHVVPGLHMAIFANGLGADALPPPMPPPSSGRSTRLTPRERQIIEMIADGLTDRDIARQLALSPATARTHARNLIGKLGAHTRAQAVAIAMRRGDIAP